MAKATHLIGTVPAWTNTGNPTRADLAVDAEIDAAGVLHMTGELRRKRAGDCDQCGQMQDTIREWIDAGEIEYAPGWDAARALRMLATWEAWHLNNMRAGCSHQRADWRTDELLTVYAWTLTAEMSKRQKESKRDAQARLEAGETVTLDEETRALLALEYVVKTPTDQPPPGYEPTREGSPWPARQTKAAGWITPAEHPGGLLGKPCEVCGYKYGTEWRREDLPADVVAAVLAGWEEVTA